MHALLQQYAAEKLAKDAEQQQTMSTQHCLHFCQWLAESEEELHGLNHVARMHAMRADMENIHAACLWAATHEHFVELDAAIESLGLYYRRETSYMTGDRLLARLARALTDVTDINGLHALAQILIWRCFFISMLGDHQKTVRLADQALSLLDSSVFDGRDTRDLQAKIYLYLASAIWVYTTNEVEAEMYFRRSFGLFKQIEDKIGMALASLSFGRFQRSCKRFIEAEAAFRLTIQLLESAGSRSGYSDALGALGTLAYLNMEFDEAEHLLTESLSAAAPDDHDAEATALFWLARTFYEAGQLDRAALMMDKSLTWRHKQGMLKFIAVQPYIALRYIVTSAHTKKHDNWFLKLWSGRRTMIIGYGKGALWEF